MNNAEIEEKVNEFIRALKEYVVSTLADDIASSSIGTYYEEKKLRETLIEMFKLSQQ